MTSFCKNVNQWKTWCLFQNKNLDKPQYCITTVVCPSFFETDVSLSNVDYWVVIWLVESSSWPKQGFFPSFYCQILNIFWRFVVNFTLFKQNLQQKIILAPKLDLGFSSRYQVLVVDLLKDYQKEGTCRSKSQKKTQMVSA